MYDLPYHREQDEGELLAFMRDHPFAVLTATDSAGMPVATQTPLLIEQRAGRVVLSGHIMVGTTHHEALQENATVLALFTGPHAYVSGRWYTDPHTPSTWNYVTVQASGTIRLLDRDGTRSLMQRLSLHFENDDESSPTVFSNLPPSFTDRALGMIVGFEMDVDSLRGVFKLSQDRDEASYESIMKELNGGDTSEQWVARQMANRRDLVFPPEV